MGLSLKHWYSTRWSNYSYMCKDLFKILVSVQHLHLTFPNLLGNVTKNICFFEVNTNSWQTLKKNLILSLIRTLANSASLLVFREWENAVCYVTLFRESRFLSEASIASDNCCWWWWRWWWWSLSQWIGKLVESANGKLAKYNGSTCGQKSSVNCS